MIVNSFIRESSLLQSDFLDLAEQAGIPLKEASLIKHLVIN